MSQGGPLPTGEGAPKKQGLTAGMIILIVVGLVFVTCVGGVTAFMMSDAGRAVREATSSAMNAQNAPGTEDLRALGCETAGVMDMSAFARLVGEDDESLPPEMQAMMERMVICASASLTCEDVAETYRASQAPEKPFVVVVSAASGSSPRCQQVISPDGEVLKDLVK